MRVLPVRCLLAALTAGALVATAAPAGAVTFGCSASAVRISVLGATAIEPTTANQGNPICATETSTLDNPTAALGLPVSASAVAATTQLDQTAQTVTAAGGIADLKVLALPSLPVSIDQITAPVQNAVNTAVNAIPVDFSSLGVAGVPISTLLGGATGFNVDATSAVQSLVPAVRALTTTQLLGLRAAMAYSAVACNNGQPVIAGTSNLAGLTIAGQELPTDQAVTKAVSLLPALSVDFSKATVSSVTQVTLPSQLAGLSAPLHALLDPLILSQVNAALAQLPTVSVPALSATVAFAPGATTRNGNSVTQQAAVISATVAGIKIAEGVIGEATASESGLECAAPVTSPNTPTGATLQCTSRKLVLVDVLQNGNRVKLTGVADPKYIGKTVSIVFAASGRTVAHAVVAKDGSFQTTAPMPGRGVRDTNSARYTAKVGHERSLDLKLRRRMIVRSMSSRGGKVTIAGRVVPPLGRPVSAIVLTQRVSCSKSKVVKRFHPDAHGNFRITVPAPKSVGTAVYRLSTYVRPSAHSHRLSPTFTLPRAVELHR